VGRLLIVSNRLPVSTHLERGELRVLESAGGLATGLKGPHRESGGLWIGWPGDTSQLSESQLASLERQLAELHTAPCHLSRQEVVAYYESTANGVLWPLFHYLIDRLPFRTESWDAYRSVNERFARLAAQHYQPGDTIWVHDYQLALVPAMIREVLPEARIGFFLHIPFPAAEVLRIFPWGKELLSGLLGADLIGFHTLSYARHFGNSLIHLLGLTPDVDHVRLGGRRVHFGAFPMGIDAAQFKDDACSPDVEARTAAIRAEAGGLRVLLGIDRLDYTKGIPRRLHAVERLLELHPEWQGKIRFVQIAVPSRTQVAEYGTFTSEVNELVGRINGNFGTPSWVPIHYLYRGFSQRELVSLYQAADVMAVTPLRDGMNLVAKEYVASRADGKGVLVLSEFAGAAAEMAEALLVNPYDVDALAHALHTALLMPEEEQRPRMEALQKRVAEWDVHRWARDFLDALGQAAAESRQEVPTTISPAVEDDLVANVREAQERLWMLDYDGTLVPFARRPELASPDAPLLELLGKLAADPRNHVHIVSGRSAEVLEDWLGELPVSLHAEHGLTSRAHGQPWKGNVLAESAWKSRVRGILQHFVDRTPGALIEEKRHSLAWHYRLCDPEFGEWQAGELKIHLTHALSNVPVAVLGGDRVVEVQPHGVSKGAVAANLLRAHPRALALAAGDDQTDETLFAVLPQTAISIHVGPRPSRARFNIWDPSEFRHLLSRLAGA
jgi:trehalose 6-phosphate synthase/phosphatase